MLFMDFITWWYGRGWVLRFSSIGLQLSHWAEFFSLGTLLKSLFAPWRQIVVQKAPDRSLNDIMRGWVDNAVSRLVGFWVRTTVFFTGLIVLALIAFLNLAYALAWPLIPGIPILLIIIGVA
jgi:hypothetical protein